MNRKKIGILALFIIAGHNLLAFAPLPNHPVLNGIMNILFFPGPRVVSPQFIFFISYPLVPWIAILLLGFACGRVFEREKHEKNSWFLSVGLSFIALFAILRLMNIYGDPNPMERMQDTPHTLLSFFNVTKYPPSFLFDLLFLGIMFVLLSLAHKLPGIWRSFFSVYGKVPMFYYLLHLYLIRLATFIMVFSQGFKWNDLLFGPFQFGRPESGSGIRLLWIYVIWLVIVLLLYPLCKWYGWYKETHKEKQWLRYL